MIHGFLGRRSKLEDGDGHPVSQTTMAGVVGVPQTLVLALLQKPIQKSSYYI
jgi:hypothetical protein